MGLSDREQKLLEELERGLMSGEGSLARKARNVGNSAARIIAGVLLVLIGLSVLVTGVVVQLPPVGVLGFLIMLGGLILALANAELPDLGSAFPKPGSGGRNPNRNFFEDRWDRRQGGQSETG